ncbi:hypothetical protein Sjap_022721 [Stephania japonica]|uniref:Subtilisin-like protease n=1 Tax=Stephania japonica TaxID=461633 RepID=A0AAP0EY78_9MAGN
MLYTYNNVIHGFSTRLTPEEAKSMEQIPGILSVLPEIKYHLHTTHTPEFLGLDKADGFPPKSNSDTASDVVIGVLDTGAWPESPSYDDRGLGPVPTGWKGECEVGRSFNLSSCNKKLIGARAFYKGYEATLGPIDESRESKSPRDDDGHGTHTSTTAAGAPVEGASLFKYASGTARGMAPRARVAVYKVCWMGGCFSADILAAMDRAVEDGVDVLSMSLGGGTSDYYRDSVAIGAFAATERGILVSCSAGNAGPNQFTLSNVAPWILTVGAGTLDRDFPAYVTLGNGKNFSGVSLYSGEPLPGSLLPLVYAGNATNVTNGNLCMTGTLSPVKVAGKIVLCDRGINARVQKGAVVKAAGGAGMILANTAANGEELVADAHLLPATSVGQRNGDAIRDYLLSDPKPTASIIFAGTKLGVQPSPVVAAFSSRGPNSITAEILKPDLIAPGVNILAGCGLAALLKSAHPDWSPAAVRSALMTTAYSSYKSGEKILDVATGKASTPFDHGSGHVDPVSALDPGLVYDATVDDYIDFLCALNYSTDQIKSLARKDVTCNAREKYSVRNLNYPSFAALFETAQSGGGGGSSGSGSGSGGGGDNRVVYSRTLTNVGAGGVYKVTVTSPSESVKVSVEPEELRFGAKNEKKTYTVTLVAGSMPSGTNLFGRLEWSDGKHIVGSPIALSWI